MSNYFHTFPTLPYDTDGTMPNKYQTVRNIMNRAKIKDSIKSDIAAYYPYLVQEGERPDILSFRYYGSVSYAYLILLFNNIIDPQFDWPLCTTTGCSYQGLGYCGSFCVGGHCDYRTVVPGQWVGNQWMEIQCGTR